MSFFKRSIIATFGILMGVAMANPTTIKVKYDEKFNPEKGNFYQFKDFILEYIGVQEMSSEEKKAKDESNARGIDGGVSMSTDWRVFNLLKLDKTTISKISMQMNPYSWESFEVKGKKYNIEYEDGVLVVRDGPLRRNRK